jgi:RND family efflux transporter MFP subunit
MSQRQLHIARGLLLAGIAVVLTSCRPAVGEGLGSASNQLTDDKPVTVQVVKAGREAVSEGLDIAGEFHPYQEIDLRARVSGYLGEIRADVGDKVRQGQLIATLLVPESSSELEQAAAASRRSRQEVVRGQSEVERAQSELEAARLTYSRLSSVIKSNPKLIAQQEVDDALARVRVADAELGATRASLSVANEQVQVQAANEAKARTMTDYTVITAPISGLITKRYADKGALIQGGSQGHAIVQLSQVDRLRLILPVPESVVPSVHDGLIVHVRVPAVGKTFDGRIARLSGKVDSVTRTMDAEVDVANPDASLKPGMHGVGEIVLAHHDSALTVPVQAVARDEKTASVMIVNAQNRLEVRDVVIGIETPTRVQISAGLADDDLVVIGSRSQLKPGQRATPKEAPAIGARKER